jgi:hypothetical protein
MTEIGGYIELDTYILPMLHEKAISLNCGRNCLAYLLKTRKINKILLPSFLCNSVSDVCYRSRVSVRYYSVGLDFLPVGIELAEDEWVYIVNYYGQLSQAMIGEFKEKYDRIIVDHAQAYFQMPLEGVDTLYSCRKFFGVPDGAFLYTESILGEELPYDVSYDRMHFLCGRFEKEASEFYNEYVENNNFFWHEPIKKMSLLTKNLLHGIDYDGVKERRSKNYSYLHERLVSVNRLPLSVPEGAFMYPLYIDNGMEIRRYLQKEKIYIPLLWPNVIEDSKNTIECDMSRNILPLPIDQRYGEVEMEYILDHLKRYL